MFCSFLLYLLCELQFFFMYSEITSGVFFVHHVVKALSKYSGVLGCFMNTTRLLWELWEYHGNT